MADRVVMLETYGGDMNTCSLCTFHVSSLPATFNRKHRGRLVRIYLILDLSGPPDKFIKPFSLPQLKRSDGKDKMLDSTER